MRHPRIPEETKPQDEQQARLTETLAVLSPIRAYRHSKSQRIWYQQRQELAKIKQSVEAKKRQIEHQLQQQRQLRQQFETDHLNKPMSPHSLNDWLNNEREMQQAIDIEQQALRQLESAQLKQQQHVEHVFQKMQAQQRDIAKLEEMQRWLDKEQT